MMFQNTDNNDAEAECRWTFMTSIAQTPHAWVLCQKISNSLSDGKFEKNVAALRLSAAYCNKKKQAIHWEAVAKERFCCCWFFASKGILTDRSNFNRGLLPFFQQMQPESRPQTMGLRHSIEYQRELFEQEFLKEIVCGPCSYCGKLFAWSVKKVWLATLSNWEFLV